MNYTKCWLEYPLIAPEAQVFTVDSEFTGPLADSAFEELTLGFGGMYGQTVRQTSGEGPVGNPPQCRPAPGGLPAGRRKRCLHPGGRGRAGNALRRVRAAAAAAAVRQAL